MPTHPSKTTADSHDTLVLGHLDGPLLVEVGGPEVVAHQLRRWYFSVGIVVVN